MTVEWSFYVENRERPHEPLKTSCYIADPARFRAMWDILPDDMGFHKKYATPGDDYGVGLLEADPRLKRILELAAEVGEVPFCGEEFPEPSNVGYFNVRRMRHYSRQDTKDADYFHIHRWGMDAYVANFLKLENGIWHARTAGAKWMKRYGKLRDAEQPRRLIDSPPLANGDLKRDLENSGLLGMEFKPVVFDNPGKAKGEFWEMTSNVTMPRCLLPLVEVSFIDTQKMTVYDDGGHFPKELQFERKAVGKLGPFDIALTTEDVIRVGSAYTRNLIVSQRCRKVFADLRMGTVELVPIRLV